MTEAGVKAYRRLNPGSKLKTAVTGKVKPGSKAAMEAENVKVQDEKDMSNVQGAKDGGRMGYRMGGKCKLAMKGKGKAYGKNS